MSEIRNIAIIAHVDHGKTTLIDSMLSQSGTFKEHQQVADRVMDSTDLERERGITILAKCTAIFVNEIKINIVDTPGHADFGGEVERVLSMVDSALLLVDAAEGPMPQTKFVLSKALALGLKPLVVINKVDRADARIDEVLNEIFDLFVALDASDEQLDFPVLYASGRNGWATNEMSIPSDNLQPLFEAIISNVAPPKVDKMQPFAMLATILEYDPYLGRILTGRVESGRITVGSNVKAIRLGSNEVVEVGKLTKLFTFRGIEKVASNEVEAGDIIAIAGMQEATVSDTICAVEVTQALKSTPIDPPTMAVTINVNDSPLAGTEGSKVTSRMIGDRLMREAESNVAIKITQSAEKDSFEVGGRGELQLGVLIETMRREGFELSVSRPRVLYKKDDNGKLLEPIEEVVIDTDEEFSGIIVEKLSMRKGEMREMKPSGGGKLRLIFLVPSRSLIGYQSEFLTDTRGTGVMSRLFNSYAAYKGDITGRNNGVLISMADGQAVAYALWNIEERGTLYINPQDKIYSGMIIGMHSRDNDLEVNPLKGKQLSNMRTTSKDEAIKLTPAKILTLEEAISFIEEDELVEVTPKNIRLRKRYLDSNDRKKFSRTKAAQ